MNGILYCTRFLTRAQAAVEEEGVLWKNYVEHEREKN